jgi:hypothetical protein
VEEALDPPADPEDEVRAIGFGTFLDRAPQNGIKPLASVLDINGLKGQGFMVEAYTTTTYDWNAWTNGARTATPNFMSAQTVKWDAASTSTIDPGTWTYSPIRYWPRINLDDWGKVTFFAYTPSPNSYATVTFVPAGATNGNPQLHYSMPTNSARHTDLIVDAAYNVTGYNNSKVKFKFDHVLSRIGFQAKIPESHYGATSITITSLAFHYRGLHTSGTYTFTGSNKDPGNWDVTGASTSLSSTSPFAGSVLLTPDPYNLAEYYTIPPHRYLMLIPQENDFEQAYVLVRYTIHYPPGTTPETHENSARVFLQPIIWEPGKAYTYTLNIAPKAVEIDVNEVEKWDDWGDEDDIPDINIP